MQRKIASFFSNLPSFLYSLTRIQDLLATLFWSDASCTIFKQLRCEVSAIWQVALASSKRILIDVLRLLVQRLRSCKSHAVNVSLVIYMTNISQLFSSTVEMQEFNTKNINHIPSFGSIIYTVFLDRSEYIYVGIGGLNGKSVQERNPRSRIIQHSQGRRSGDQFCIYIQDFYVIP